MLKDDWAGFSCFTISFGQTGKSIPGRVGEAGNAGHTGGNSDSAYSKPDKALALQLDTIFDNDPKHRKEVVELAAEYGWESKEVKA